MSAVASWLGSGVGVGSAALAVAVQPSLLVPILVTGAALGGLPLLLIATLTLVVVYSPDLSRQDAAERVLDRLLTTLRPRDPAKVTSLTEAH
jgi:hypothetical protein